MKSLCLLLLLLLFVEVIIGDVCGGFDCGVSLCCDDQQNGPQCYTQSEYTCINNSKLCTIGNGACGTFPNQYCYNTAQYTCSSNGQLVQGASNASPTTIPLSTATPSPPTTRPLQVVPTATPSPIVATPTVAAVSTNSNNCGNINCGGTEQCCLSSSGVGSCYTTSQYTCSNGMLCSVGLSACGGACYNPSMYHCVGGQLQQGGSISSTTGSVTSSTTSSKSSTAATTSTTTATAATSTTATASTISTATTTTTTSGSSGNVVAVKLWGLDYNPRTAEGDCPTLQQVEADITVLATLTTRIRLYSIDDCNQGQLVLQAIKNTGVNLTVALGIWLDEYYDVEFPNEYSALLNITNTLGLSGVSTIIVGSETQYRGNFAPSLLLSFLQNISTTLVAKGYTKIYVVTADVVYNLEEGALQPVINFESIAYMNQFPYFEGINITLAANYMTTSIANFSKTINNKQIIVSETGWPTAGDDLDVAVPSTANLQLYLQEMVCYFYQHNIAYYWFEAFDEPWNAAGVEQNFGVYSSARTPKSGISLPIMCPV